MKKILSTILLMSLLFVIISCIPPRKDDYCNLTINLKGKGSVKVFALNNVAPPFQNISSHPDNNFEITHSQTIRVVDGRFAVLTAIPQKKHKFDYWDTDPIKKETTIHFDINGDMEFTANFVKANK